MLDDKDLDDRYLKDNHYTIPSESGLLAAERKLMGKNRLRS